MSRTVWLFILFILMGCEEKKQAIIQEKVTERVAKERAKKSSECRNMLVKMASAAADSLLLENARKQLQDSLLQNRPIRPLKPTPLPPLDSGEVKPIF